MSVDASGHVGGAASSPKPYGRVWGFRVWALGVQGLGLGALGYPSGHPILKCLRG